MITDYHAKLFAHELGRRRSVADAEKLAGALLDAQVDLNPHQVEAALFAFKSPLSMGAILADEVGLGKTIEAGLVLAQKWTEGKRRILVITPANLRKQWSQEIEEKFFLPTMILEAKNYNRMAKDGVRRPFEQKKLVICSFQFAARHAEELMVIPWDLVVIDEAHRLRNVHRPDNRIGRALKGALANAPKVLLTATPLQNSLMELYGLVSLIDDYAFGDAKSFRAQYARLTGENEFNELKARLQPVCHRTLRRQVLEYIRYTNRIPITQEFVPTEAEQKLYDMVSDYLRRPSLQALPSSQRTLMTLIMRKLLASSTFAIAGALDSLARKLERQLRDDKSLREKLEEEISEDYEDFEEMADEWEEEAEPELLTEADIQTINKEIADLRAFRDLAVSIAENAKGQALLQALRAGFANRPGKVWSSGFVDCASGAGDGADRADADLSCPVRGRHAQERAAHWRQKCQASRKSSGAALDETPPKLADVSLARPAAPDRALLGGIGMFGRLPEPPFGESGGRASPP